MVMRIVIATSAALAVAAAVVVVAVVLSHRHNLAPPPTTSSFTVNLSGPMRPMPDTLFGVFFEEINHAGSGGLWAELVSNRGFEAGGDHSPADIIPWSVLGDASSIVVSTDMSSPFKRNKVALKMEVLKNTSNAVGVYNPGFWGMNIVGGQKYRIILHVRSRGPIDLTISFASSDGFDLVASAVVSAPHLFKWTKMEIHITANRSDTAARLQLTTTRKGVMWFDQVSAMPVDTYKGHGFRKDLFRMIAELRPSFLRFPGGTYVEGLYLRNSFHWKETVGPWEERSGHYGDVWSYWTDDGLGFFELLLLAEDLNTEAVWVVNCGISRNEQINTSQIQPYVQEMIDGLEFARGDAASTWGSLRVQMGHPRPFRLQYVAIGNEDCDLPFYRGNYLAFYEALKQAYPDIQSISNCDQTIKPLDHPADLFDFHRYTAARDMFGLRRVFDATPRRGPKAFVSEYAVTNDAGLGNIRGAVAEAAFLMGVERNSDVVDMTCYAPLFMNVNDKKWIPDAIVFNASTSYGTPSYWMQLFFRESNGASLVPSLLQTEASIEASAILWRGTNNTLYTRVKVVNFANVSVDFRISFLLDNNVKQLSGISKMILKSANETDENSFENPNKVLPISSPFQQEGNVFNVYLPPYSLQAFDFLWY